MNKVLAFWVLLVDTVVFTAQHALPPRQPLTWIDAAVHLGAIVLALVVAYPERVMPFLALVAGVIPSIRLSKAAPDPREPDITRDDERGEGGP